MKDSNQHSLQINSQKFLLYKMQLKTITLLFSFVCTIYSICRDPNQSEGECTSCSILDNLVDGACYPKITGCIKYLSTDKCSLCQFSYNEDNGICIKLKVMKEKGLYEPILFTNPYNLSKNQIDSVLTYNQILDKVGLQNENSFTLIHEYFLIKYPQIDKGLINDILTVSGKTGLYLTIIYYKDKNARFQACALVTSINKIQQLYFKNYKQSQAQFSVLKVAKNILPKSFVKLGNSSLLQILKNSEDNYSFYFINGQNSNIIYKVTTGVASKFNKTTLKLNQINKNDFVIQKYIRQTQPAITQKITILQTGSGFYLLKIGSKFNVAVQYDGINFVAHNPTPSQDKTAPIQSIPQISVNASNQKTSNLIIGGYADTDVNDPILKRVLTFARQKIPQLKQAQVTRAQSQVVAGLIFIVYLSNAAKIDYQIKVYYPLDSKMQLIYAFRGKDPILDQFYPFNKDSQAIISYLDFKSQMKSFLDLPIIESMSYSKLQKGIRYQIFYQTGQSAQYQLNTATGKVTPLSFMNKDGINILKQVQKNTQEKQISQYLESIEQNKQKIGIEDIDQVDITSIDINGRTTNLTFVSPIGTYNMTLWDIYSNNAQQPSKAKPLVTGVTKLSNQTCVQIDPVQINLQKKLTRIYVLLKTNYLLDDYRVANIQKNQQKNKTVYKVLFTSSKFKQILFLLSEIYNSDTFNVISARVLNNGLEVSPPRTQDYDSIASRMAGTPWLINKLPYLVQSNSTHIQTIAVDPRTTYMIVTNKLQKDITKSVEVFPIKVSEFIPVPSELNFLKLIIPGKNNANQNITVNKIINEAALQYPAQFSASNVYMVQKDSNNYAIMMNSSVYGYFLLRASVNLNTNAITISKPIMTQYKTSDFTNCAVKDVASGKCKSCQSNKIQKYQYQGNCYKKIEGCMFQVGTICFRCLRDYIKVNQKCVKDCGIFTK